MSQTLEHSSLKAARAAKAVVREYFVSLVPVAGIGITRIGSGYGLKVNLQEPLASGVSLPENIGGVAVRVEIIGPIYKR